MQLPGLDGTCTSNMQIAILLFAQRDIVNTVGVVLPSLSQCHKEFFASLPSLSQCHFRHCHSVTRKFLCMEGGYILYFRHKKVLFFTSALFRRMFLFFISALHLRSCSDECIRQRRSWLTGIRRHYPWQSTLIHQVTVIWTLMSLIMRSLKTCDLYMYIWL